MSISLQSTGSTSSSATWSRSRSPSSIRPSCRSPRASHVFSGDRQNARIANRCVASFGMADKHRRAAELSQYPTRDSCDAGAVISATRPGRAEDDNRSRRTKNGDERRPAVDVPSPRAVRAARHVTFADARPALRRSIASSTSSDRGRGGRVPVDRVARRYRGRTRLVSRRRRQSSTSASGRRSAGRSPAQSTTRPQRGSRRF
jgi:hypothetical protein